MSLEKWFGAYYFLHSCILHDYSERFKYVWKLDYIMHGNIRITIIPITGLEDLTCALRSYDKTCVKKEFLIYNLNIIQFSAYIWYWILTGMTLIEA